MPETSAGMKEIIEKVTPLLETEEFDKAVTEAETIIKAHPEMTDDEKAQVLLGLKVSPLMQKGDVEATLKQVDAVMSAYPNSSIAKQKDAIKESIKQQIEMMKEMKDAKFIKDFNTEIKKSMLDCKYLSKEDRAKYVREVE